MKKLLLAGLAAGAWSSCALAADLGPYNPPPRYEPVYEPVREGPYNWQGLYLGLNTGYGWGNDNAASFSAFGGSSGAINPSGWFGGGQVGYNAQFNYLVLGLEADLQARTSATRPASQAARSRRPRPISIGSPRYEAASVTRPDRHCCTLRAAGPLPTSIPM